MGNSEGVIEMLARIRSFRWFRKAQDGQSLVFFALMAPLVLGMVGLAIDAGRVLGTRAELQKAADAAALAGAQDLPDADSAVEVAHDYVLLNASGEALDEATVQSVSETNDTIIVSAEQYVGFTFLKVLGIEGMLVEATAQATMTKGVVTGFTVDAVAPFSIWGGDRDEEVNPGDGSCVLHVCGGESYTFMATDWMDANGNPARPDWTASNSNNFKGDLNHGDGAEVLHIGDDWLMRSNGGLGSVEVPNAGDEIVVPVFTSASGNSNLRTFEIGGWVVLEVDPGCRKQHCSGTVVPPVHPTTPLPDGWAIGGAVLPPEALQYEVADVGLSR